MADRNGKAEYQIKQFWCERSKSLSHQNLCPTDTQADLEVELQCQLNSSVTVLSDNSTERAQRIWINRKALGRIAERAARLDRICACSRIDHTCRSPHRNQETIAVRVRLSAACRINREERIQRQTRAAKSSDVSQVRIGESLIKEIEDPEPELQLLALRDVEVLKERHIEVAGGRATNIERRTVRAAGAEGRDRKGRRINVGLIESRIARYWIARDDRHDGRGCRVTAWEGVVAEEGEQNAVAGHCAGELNMNGSPALEGCNAGHLPAVEHAFRKLILKRPARQVWQIIVVGEIDDVRSVKRQNAVAASACVERIDDLISIRLVDGSCAKRLRERIGQEVLQPPA